MISLLRRIFHESLFRNSVYLMASTGVLALFGFLFWVVNARLFSIEDVGFATTLISMMNLISMLSLVGFNASLVRFLPQNKKPNEMISSALMIVMLTSFALAASFVAFIPLFSPRLAFVQSSALAITLFILFCILSSLNTLTDSVFLAHRRSHFILIINAIFSAARLVFPFLLISLGAIGIFAAAGIAQTIGFLVSFAAMMLFFGYLPTRMNMTEIKALSQYSIGNYAASSLNLLPATLLPLLITTHLGPAESAYYYICLMIANFLYVVPFATARALFAEGSNTEAEFPKHVVYASKLILALMIPAIIIVAFTGHFSLGFFGPEYAAGGTTLLTLFAIAGFAVSAMSVINVYFLVTKDTSAMIAISGVYALSTLGLSYALLKFGLTGVGVAWIAGNTLAAFTGLVLYRYPLRLKERYAAIKYELWTRYTCFLRNRRARKAGRPSRTVLFYPDFPKYYYVLYTICHELGYRMSNEPTKPYDVAFFFNDVTVRGEDPLEGTIKRKARLINSEARDISKETVEKNFAEVFGYGTKIDPRTHVGECVQKSNDNAMHDGKVVICPREPEPGYIYQKLINNRDGDRVADIRVKVVGDAIPFIMYRTRSVADRFDNTETSTMVPIETHLSQEEKEKILRFCKKMGLEFSALDCLRDNDDGRLYIVDANLTTGGPMPGFHLSHAEYEVYIRKFSIAFEKAFMHV